MSLTIALNSYHPSGLPVRHGARLLTTLTLLREGLSIGASAGDFGYGPPPILAVLSGIRFADLHDPALNELARAGEILEQGDWPDLPPAIAALITEAVTGASTLDDGLSLDSLQPGSEVGVIKDGIKAVEDLIRKILELLGSFLPGRDRAACRDALRPLILDGLGPLENPALRRVRAGLLVHAVDYALATLEQTDATDLRISQSP